MDSLPEGVFPTVDFPVEEIVPSLTAGFYPCNGVGQHDFAVGPEHAICNRCSAVVTLKASDEPIYRTDHTT